MSELSAAETSAIASLERLAKRWPQSLMLFSWSGALCVIKLNEDGSSPRSHRRLLKSPYLGMRLTLFLFWQAPPLHTDQMLIAALA